MAALEASDGSEDVNDFLRRIRELGEKRDREDAERSRKLEEDILEGRRQREARRAERARSLSPEKYSPSISPHVSQPSRHSSLFDVAPGSPLALKPSVGPGSRTQSDSKPVEAPVKAPKVQMATKTKTVEDVPTAFRAAQAVNTLSRQSSLSWQQRPMPLREARSRPTSLLGLDTETSHKSTEGSPEPSRREISKALGSKDPSWFHQTPDRGIGNRGYKKDPDAAGTALDTSVGRQMLPGLSTILSPPNPKHSASAEIARPTSKPTTLRGRATLPTSPMERLESSVAASLPPEHCIEAKATPPSTPPVLTPELMSQSRFERSISPTKGMGGFVQSAMLRRTDSLTKRWSGSADNLPSRPESASGLKKVDPGSPRRLSTSKSMPRLVAGMDNSEATKTNKERESSRSSELTRLHTAPSSGTESASLADGSDTPPSPSKRWSAVKSTWLETALKRPESPKPQTISTQPEWLAELGKSKQRAIGKDSIKPLGGSETTTEITVPNSQLSKSTMDNRISCPTSPAAKLGPVAPKPKPTTLLQRPLDTKVLSMNQNPTTMNKSKDDKPKQVDLIDSKPKPHPKPVLTNALPPKDKDTAQPLEFQNAFGKLRRTQAEKYTAPNEFKDNIMRGKAALSGNESPEKSPIRDEGKNVLLNIRGSLKPKPSIVKPSLQIHARSTSDLEPFIESNAAAPKKLPVAKPNLDIAKAHAGSQHSPGTLESSKDKPILDKPILDKPILDKPILDKPILDKLLDKPLVEKPNLGGSKLANRFNPGLANILAKGPPGPGPIRAATDEDSAIDSGTTSIRTSSISTKPAQLQHMTKGRAKGPKRRAPTSQKETGIDSPIDAFNINTPYNESATTTQIKAASSTVTKQSISVAKRAPALKQKDDAMTDQKPAPPSTSSRNITPLQPLTLEVNSRVPAKTLGSTMKATTAPSIHNATPSPPRKAATFPLPAKKPTRLVSTSESKASDDVATPTKDPGISARNNDVQPVAHMQGDADTEGDPETSVRNISAQWGRSTISVASSAAARVRSPIRLPTRADEEAAVARVGLVSESNTTKLSGHALASKITGKNTVRLEASPADHSTSLPVDSQLLYSDQVIAPTEQVPDNFAEERPPIPQPTDALDLLKGFFLETPTLEDVSTIDVQGLLDPANPEENCTQTLQSSISQLTGDGQTIMIPASQLYILQANSMYILTHAYASTAKTRLTEMYMWIGNAVSDSTFQTAKIFALRTAKEKSSHLTITKQGRETVGFLTALGGIFVTRLGLRNEETGSYIIAGRRFQGHIVFDEVELSMDSLCSGYPYLVIAKSTKKTYLWKGIGCSADELDSARLLAALMYPAHSVVEVDQASETADFLNTFPGSAAKSSTLPADYWKLKPRHSKYAVRLFHISRDARPQPKVPLWKMMTRRPSAPDLSPNDMQTCVTEIAPFLQEDVEAENIYVLDAFFELYVIVGLRSAAKPQAFSAAVLFAQDYGILAASMQDRPFVPISKVVMGGMPHEVRAAFRGCWEEESNEGVEEGSVCVSLSEVITALRQ